ncbi:MAG TPA: adenylate kinase [Steroidobacteraceae bacterium]|jgi:adenylate kinase|nr:adenylate kinase [Steroidobacteraceae bacterium]
MRIVLLGAPGSGKGTQSQRLMQHEHIPQISTGDLLRAAVAHGTELGRKAKEAMDGGRLVDDELVLGMIRERLAEPDARRGFILDGFPRNLAQAQALDRLLATLRQPLDAVVQLEVDYGELVRRISGRRTCADCGRVFNLSSSPAQVSESEPCPRTAAPHRLIQRPDDNEATVTERLRVYDEQTRPLIEFYRARGLLRVINAEGAVDEVTRRLEQALHATARAEVANAAVAQSRKTRSPRRSGPRQAPSRRPAKSASGSKRKPAAPTTRATTKGKPARRAPGGARAGRRRTARRARR